MSADYDIIIIGGGINGCGIARDAVGRGYSVYLCEQGDLASGTSSQSTKLIHGGLRYLENYEFGLVREALMEREVLWKIAPHIIHPLRFILPHHKGLRPAWLLRLGLFLYDHIDFKFGFSKNKLPKTSSLNLSKDESGHCLKPSFTKAFEYSDCAVDDARLVVLNALDASERGASINAQTKCTAIQRENDYWSITVEDQLGLDQKTEQEPNDKTITGKVVINASGPWVDKVIDKVTDYNNASSQQSDASKKPAHNVRLVQGSHIIVPKLYDHEKCYIFQNEDNRIIFAIPYHEKFTLIGTTDHEFSGDPYDAKITQQEIDYLIISANAYFKKEINESDIVATYSGVRSLYDDGASKAQETTRDYVIRVDQDKNEKKAPIINIFGGKITTYRHLAESALEKVKHFIPARLPIRQAQWTASSPLPGGDFAIDDFEKYCETFHTQYGFLNLGDASRLFKQYGTRANQVLGDAKSYDDLGFAFGHGLYQREVEYLIDKEWAKCSDDILWRRTKLGLLFNKNEQEILANWISKSDKTKQT